MKNLDTMIEKNILKELKNNNLTVFAGAGLSRGSGYVDWGTLLRDIADNLGLTIDKETDLVAIAQYYCNEHGRQEINEAIIEQFEKEAQENENLNILAQLPIQVYWTTNYDSLIEDTLRKHKKNVDKKINQSQLKYYKPNRDIVVYKMHGDKEDPDNAVITRDDYEGYNQKRGLFTTNLKGQLIEKTFLFIGFSFEDPNLEQILSKIRVELIGDSPKKHYCFFRSINREDYKNEDKTYNEEEYIQDKIKQELKVKDLKRYGIHTILVDEYRDITQILSTIYVKYKLENIFISGSAEEYGQFDREDAETLIHNLARDLITENYNIISGFGLGVGGYVINGALEEIYSKGNYIDDRLILRPFPQKASGDKDLPTLWREYREEMISLAGISIFLFGNKIDKASGDIITANGMLQEYEIAKERNNFIIPIAVTGYVAKEIMNDVKKDLRTYWYLEESIDILETERDTAKLIKEVLNIIRKIKLKL